MPYLEIENVHKRFGAFHALKGVSLSVEEGEFVSFLGGSGCGKTTTLRIIAGFEAATSGSVRLAGKDLGPLRPERRPLGFVFQNYALFPNMTVRRNLSFGLKGLGLSRQEQEERVDELLDKVRLGEFGHRYPRELSGGQQQRVALARALARRPKVLLLDEPLSALDAKIRVHLRGELRALQRELGLTAVYVTHDQEEALSMSDRIVLMRDGEVEQAGTPEDLYQRPATAYAAAFIGTVNRLSARVVDPGSGRLAVAGRELSVPGAEGLAPGEAIQLLARPERLRLGEPGPGEASLGGRLRDVQFLGSVRRWSVDLGEAGTVVVDAFNDGAAALALGGTVTVSFSPEALRVGPSS